MQVKEISYGATVKIGDDYYKASYTAIPSSNVEEDMTALKDMVMKDITSQGQKPVVTKSPTEVPPKTTRAPRKPKTATEEPKKEETVEAPKPATRRPRRSAKPKTVKYDRTKEDHKLKVIAVVDEKFPGWKEDKGLKTKVAAASHALVDVDFIGDDGNILESFISQLVKEIKGEEEGTDVL